jgi:hypothetical protein
VTDDEQRIREALAAVRGEVTAKLDAMPVEEMVTLADETAQVFALLNRTSEFTEKWVPHLVELQEAIDASPPIIREYMADMLWAIGYTPGEAM